MNKILEKLYFFTKLSSSIILLIIVIFLVFLFSKIYMKQEENPKSSLKDEVDNIKYIIDENLKLNKEEISNLSKTINSIESSIQKLQKQNINNQNNELNEEIKKLSKIVNQIVTDNKKIKIDQTQSFDNKKELLNRYLQNISISIEKGVKFQDFVKELSLLFDKDYNSEYLNKLNLISNGSILSFIELQNSFEISSDQYLKKYLIQKSDNSFFSNIILKFFTLKADHKTKSNDSIIRSLSIANEYLYEKNISFAINELSKLEDSEQIFKKWIVEASKYNDALELINNIKKQLEL